jgi:hypothetical protein
VFKPRADSSPAITVLTALAGGAVVVAVEDPDDADDAAIVTGGAAAADPLGAGELAPLAAGVIAVAVVARTGEPVPAAGDGAEPGVLAGVVLPAVCAPPTPE